MTLQERPSAEMCFAKQSVPALFLIDLRTLASHGTDALPLEAARLAPLQREARRINDLIFAQCGATAAFPPFWLSDRWWVSPHLDWLRPRARDVLETPARLAGPAATLLIDDPRLAFTLPFWLQMAESACCVILGEDSPLTGAPTPGDPPLPQPGRLLALWQAYSAAALLHSRAGVRLVVRADQLNDPVDLDVVAARIDDLLGIQAGQSCHAQIGQAVQTRTTPRDATPLRPGLTDAQRALISVLQSPDLDEPSDRHEAALRGALAEARIELERGLLEDGFRAHELLGRQCAQLDNLRQLLGELVHEKLELETQLTVTRRAVHELRETLLDELGGWCTLDDLTVHGARLKRLIGKVDAVRNSLTYRIAEGLLLPVRMAFRQVAKIARILSPRNDDQPARRP